MEAPRKQLIVVILAAGKGTRMNTPNLPKVLHKLNNKPLIDHVVDTAIDLSPDQIIVVVGHQYHLVINHLKYRYSNLTYAFQKKQLGTADAVKTALPTVNRSAYQYIRGRMRYYGDILVLSGDVPLITSTTLQHMIDHHKKTNSIITFATTHHPNPSGLGRIIRNKNDQFEKIIEEKDITDPTIEKIKEINSGIYLFDHFMIGALLDKVNNKNNQGEYYLPDAINNFNPDYPQYVQSFEITNPQEVQGINTIEQLQELET